MLLQFGRLITRHVAGRQQLSESTPEDVGLFRFSTDDLPARDRLAIWREVFGRKIGKVDLEPAGDGPFRYVVNLRSVDGLRLGLNETNGFVAARTRDLLADGNDEFSFTTILSGTGLASHAGRELPREAGQAVLLSTADISTLRFAGPARFVGLRIPRRTLADLVAEPESAVLQPMPRNSEALRLLVNYIAMTSEMHDLATPQLRRLFSTHVLDLVALAIGASREGVELAQRRGLRAARLYAIKTDIRANLGRPRVLSLDALAARHAISPVYIRKLFEGENTSFTQFVLDERLARVHHMLSDPRLADRSIGSLALEAGFNDVSYFNRTFRRRYGASPSDVRTKRPDT